jgi:general secretion pathway protein D
MKTYRLLALAVVLAMPVLVTAAEPVSSPCAASSSAPDDGIELTDLIERVAKRTGKQFIVDPRVRATVPKTGLDIEKVDYARLLAILSVNMFVAYESDGIVRVVPDANARQLPVPVNTEVPAKALADELVTVIFQAKNMCAAQAVPVLRPLMPQAGHLATFPQTNTLLISDRAANARRILDMAERLDKAAPAGQKCTEPAAVKSDAK